MNTKMYVGNLSFDMSEVELRDLFSEHGQVNEVALMMDRETNRPRGFAFVTMASVDEARRAVTELSGKDFMGRPLQLSGAKPNTRGDGSGSSFQPEEEAAQAA